MRLLPRYILCLLSVCALALAARADEKPNIVLVLLDDLGYSDLGCYGGEIPTPSIDKLAHNGVRFTHFYNSARCCPSRASLVTGLYPHQAGIGSFTRNEPHPRNGPAYLGRLTDECVTLAEVLKGAGYTNYMVGKWHMGAPGPIGRGFDEFYGYTRGYAQDQWEPDRYVRLPEGREQELKYEKEDFYATDVFNDYALEFLDQATAKEEPFFLYLAHSSPHFPVQAPPETTDTFVDTYREGWDALREKRFQRMMEMGLIDGNWKLPARSMVPVDGPRISNGYGGKSNPAWADLPEDRREDLARRMAIFAAMVKHIDDGVGKITRRLEEAGELDNTLILLLSDNGACYEWGPFGFDGPSRQGITRLHTGDELERMGGPGTWHAYGSAWSNLGNTPFRMYKHFTHEGGVNTPFIAHWPARLKEPGGFIREPGHLIDIMPTICEAAGATYPKRHNGAEIIPVEGVSLLGAFQGEELPDREIYFEHQQARAVRDGKWKAVWVGKRWPEPITWELYNLEADPTETNDLSKEMPELTEKLARKWLDWAAKVKVYPFFEGAEL